MVLVTYNTRTLLLETSLTGKALDFGFREYRFESCVSKFFMITNRYSYTINHIKFTLARKALYGRIIDTRKSYNLLKLLTQLHVIRRFHKGPDNTLIFYPAYDSRCVRTHNIKMFYKNKTHLYFKYKSLQVLKNSLLSSYFILETSRGLMTHHDALKHRVGGFVVCFIN